MPDLTVDAVWTFTEQLPAAAAVEHVQRIESLGYSTVWLPETAGRDPFAHIGMLLANTDRLTFGTGIANIFHRHPGAMKQAAYTLAEQSGGRFVLGIGVSHGPFVAGLRGLDYSKPLSTMRDDLTGYEASPFSAVQPEEPPKKVLAALGPKMLELAREAADGAHPYWVTPEHTATARQILGPDKLLFVEQKVVRTTDRATAHAAIGAALSVYKALPNYRNNWKRLGYTEDEIEQGAPRFLDAVVPWGDADTIRARLQDHRDAGATHVCIQALDPGGAFGPMDWEILEALAPSS